VQVDGVFAGDDISDGAAAGLASGGLVGLGLVRHCGGCRERSAICVVNNCPVSLESEIRGRFRALSEFCCECGCGVLAEVGRGVLINSARTGRYASFMTSINLQTVHG